MFENFEKASRIFMSEQLLSLSNINVLKLFDDNIIYYVYIETSQSGATHVLHAS